MIIENIKVVKQNVEKIVKNQNRTIDDITLLAVTKTHPVEMVEEALMAGIDCIAENKVQESLEKIPKITIPFSEFHFIGHLQTNKVNKIMQLRPTLIHSIDKFSTAKKINDYCVKNDFFQSILIQVNTSSEETKYGIEPSKVEMLIHEIKSLSHIQVKGLMTIGKHTSNHDEIRTCFRLLKKLFEQIKEMNIQNVSMEYLSMGMTSDYQIALEEGSNLIRIGSAIFGFRNYK